LHLTTTTTGKISRRFIASVGNLMFLRLGASLYVPANREYLTEIANGEKYSRLRSVIFCTEDSVNSSELPFVLRNLEVMLTQMASGGRLMRFIRVRSPEVLAQCLQMNGIQKIDGFVLPKVTTNNLESYMGQFRREDSFMVMVTLETQEAFDYSAMLSMRAKLLHPQCFKRVLSLRIGGNDLLSHLGIRRVRQYTIYDTPLSYTISMLVSIFRPYGFNLTAPVCDYLNASEMLRRECRLDLAHGLFGKTAIHPEQVPVIEEQYMVSPEDLEMAKAMLDPQMPAVFRLHDSMCEPATHADWAEQIIARADIYGIVDSFDMITTPHAPLV
jgi:citrate lyase beta subunit